MLNPGQDWGAEEADSAIPAAAAAPELIDFVEALPFGLSIAGTDGATICVNAQHDALVSAGENPALVSRTFDFKVAGRGYVASLKRGKS